MAEQAADGLLLYLIDMAILEVKRKARSSGKFSAVEQAIAPNEGLTTAR
jgi:hypothetical protein